MSTQNLKPNCKPCETLETKLVRDPSQARRAVEALSELIAAVEAKEIAVTPEGDLVGTINKRIAALDQEVNEGLNEVMHNDSFCKLEASWRDLTISQRRDRNHAEASSFERHEGRDSERILNARSSSTRAPVQKIYEKNMAPRRQSLQRAGRRLRVWPQPQDIKWLEKMSNVPRRARSVHRGGESADVRHGLVRRAWQILATSRNSSKAPNSCRRSFRSEDSLRRALYAALPAALALRQRRASE